MTAARQLALLDDPIDLAWLEFHHDHPEVYRELVRRARQIRAAGHATYSLKTIVEVLRWEADLTGVDDGIFRLNNNYVSRYSRLIQANEPDLAGMFPTRTLHADWTPPRLARTEHR